MGKRLVEILRLSLLKRLALTGVSCIIVLGGILAWQIVRADGRILPHVSIGGIDVGGLTPEEARGRLQNALRAFNLTGLSFTHGDRTLTVLANEDRDDDRPPLIAYDVDGMVDRAFAFGHDGGAFDLAKANLRALFTQVILPTDVEADRAALRKTLSERFTALERLKRDADVRISFAVADASSTPIAVIEIVPETIGASFDYDAALDRALADVPRWRGSVTKLELRRETPEITAEEAARLRPRLNEILSRAPLLLAYDDRTWPIESEALAEALTIKAGPDGEALPALRPSLVEPILKKAAAVIESDPLPTRLTLKDGRADSFQGGSIGKFINRDNTFELIDARLSEAGSTIIPIVVDIVPASDSDALAEELGIRELLGYGTSNFSGSPQNRRKNIANGARLLNGLIFKPGEEIGLLEHLKPFDDKNGYFPELVIKDKRTVPEFGGGLCQIGTTTFRAVMGSGLPITQRQNHSYRVAYYEPAGTDATLYDPAPDFRFVNDTGSHILLVAKQVPGKDQLRFEFWGTRDGRVQQQSKIRVWDVTPPPEPKYIETSELAEGKKRCFETPHAGAKTSFTYTIVYPDGQLNEKEFKSIYKPWQEQCLVGKIGAPRIIIDKDGSIKELPPKLPAPVVEQAPAIQ